MKDAEEERGVGMGLVSSNKQPSYDGEEQPALGYENDERGTKRSLIVFLTHRVKEEFEEVKESLVLSGSPEQIMQFLVYID